MHALHWEMTAEQTYRLDYHQHVYQLKIENDTFQFFEDEYKILEESKENFASKMQSDKKKQPEELLLEWGRMVLEAFFKECGICKEQRIAFPLPLTPAPPEEAALCRSKGIEVLCPHCVDNLHQQAKEKNMLIKQAFLRGEMKVFGGTDQELVELMQSSTGNLVQQFATIVYPNWNLGALRFSENRLYLALIKMNDEVVDTFSILVETQTGQITSMRADIALESLGFQEGDNLQFLSFQ